MRAYRIPIDTTGIAANNLSDVLQRQGFGVDSEVLIEFGVHLMFCQPKAKHRHLVREIEQLDAIKLAQRDNAVIHKQDFTLWRTFALQSEDIHFEETKTFIRDNQEVAATTSWVEELHPAHTLQQSVTFLDDRLQVLIELLYR